MSPNAALIEDLPVVPPRPEIPRQIGIPDGGRRVGETMLTVRETSRHQHRNTCEFMINAAEFHRVHLSVPHVFPSE